MLDIKIINHSISMDSEVPIIFSLTIKVIDNQKVATNLIAINISNGQEAQFKDLLITCKIKQLIKY